LYHQHKVNKGKSKVKTLIRILIGMLTNKVSSVNCYDLNLLIIDAVSFKMFDNLKAKFNQ
jgi:hypothetical protein